MAGFKKCYWNATVKLKDFHEGLHEKLGRGAQCQSQLQHYLTPALSFSWFLQSCQAKIGHDSFLAHLFQVSIL